MNHNSHIRIKSGRGRINAESRFPEESSYGIIGGNIEIINGRVDASSDSYGGDNCGIYCWQSLTIDGGQVNADGSSYTSNSWGISGAEGSTITIRENVKEGEVTYVSASGNQGAIGPVEVLTEIRGEANDGSGTAYEIWEDEAPQAFRDGNTWYKEVTLHGHPFKFELSEDGATITATCIANPCTLPGRKTTLTINAPEELTYDGTPKAATVTDPDKIGRKAEVRYYKAKADGGRDGAELGAAPVNAGTYRAEITLESKVDEAKTAYVVYTIEPAELTVTTGGATKTYDSKALTDATISAAGLAAGETVTLKAIGSQTDAGCSANTYSITWGTALEGNYFITEKLGTLEVTPRELTVTTGGASKTYDSTPLTSDEANIVGFAGGEEATVTATGSRTDAGSSANTCSIVWGTAKESNYSVTENLGTLTVEPKPVTLKAENAEKDYDGIALTQPKFPPPSLADGDAHVFAVTMTEASTITKAGAQPNEIATVDGAAVPSGTPTVVGNYLVTTQKGSLIVNQAMLTVTADSAAKVYDGTELTKDSYRAAGLAQSDRISEITVTGSQTEAGTCDNIPSGIKILNRDGEDVTESYLITPVNGTLAVTRKKLTITAESDTRIYDGTALENEKYSSSDLAEGDQIDSVSVTGSRTETGKAENTPSGARIVNSNGNDVTASYEIAYQKGTLEVTQRPLTVIAESDTKVYDGTALVNSGYSSMGLAQGDGIVSVSVTGSQTEAGEAENTPSAAKILNKDGKDVTGNYRITYRNGTLKVTLNQGLIIIADSAAKVYDGKPLEAGGYKAKGLAEGDRVGSVKITGSQTGAGTGKNIPSDAKILNAQGGDVTANYDISFLEGTLSVTRKVLTVIADSAAKTYDGLPLTKDSFTSSGLAEDDRIDSVKITGSQTRAGTGKNVPSDVKILNAQDEDVTANYEVTLFEGTLEVSRKPLTVTADSAAKAYDGLPLTMESYTVTGLAEGDRIDSVKVTGSQTEVGSGDNTASDAKILNAKGEDVTDCYQSEYKNGVLQVMMRKIATVTADNLSKVYGEADPELTAKTAGTADGGTIAYTVFRVEGEDAGTYAITPSGEKEQGIYTVEYVTGAFTIIKAPSFGTVRAAEGLKADGTEKELVTAEKVSGGTMKYALGDDDKTAPEDGWDTKAPTASAAGTWYVWYKVEGDRNHTDTDPECATVIIAKQERTLTIRYLYTDGSEAAEAYREILTEGKKYSVTAPKITGYQADPKKVSGVMPDEDVLVTVVYRMTGSEPSGRTYHAQFISVDDTKLQLTWEPVTGAEGYDIFFIACGDLKAELYDTVTGSSALNSYVFSGLEKGVPYKARVHAWETTTDGKQYIGEMSYQVHAIPGGSNETETDAKEIAIRQKSLVLSAGETKQLDVVAKGYASKLPLVAHGANALTYYSSNSRIAQVDSEGVVTGVAAGTCTVYVTAQNGLRAGVRVTVGNYGFVLPENTKKIDESTFEGIPAKTVYVPDGCTAIGADAFRGCLALKTVRLPKNCKIAANAFRECKALATVTAPAGGTAEQWAKENGLAFIPE